MISVSLTNVYQSSQKSDNVCPCEFHILNVCLNQMLWFRILNNSVMMSTTPGEVCNYGVQCVHTRGIYCHHGVHNEVTAIDLY